MELSIKELNELIYSLGTTATKGMLCDKELNASLLNKLYTELNRKLSVKESIDESQSFLAKLQKAADRYGDEVRAKHIPIKLAKKERGWITQAMLDYVDEVGAATFTEMNDFYKTITLGSNSFTHILQNLKVPYKNRPTQRYLVKEGKKGSNAKWVVKVANPYNWVIVNDYDEFSNQ